MRKLAMTAVLAAAALMAQGARAAEDAAKERAEAKEEAQEAAKATQEEAQKESSEAQQKAKDQMGTGSAQTGQMEEKKHPVFEGKDNFSIDGKVQKVSKNTITLSREELPPATLVVSKDTKIEMDGAQASVQQLKPGQEVKASFNLKGEKPEAVEIKAETAK